MHSNKHRLQYSTGALATLALAAGLAMPAAAQTAAKAAAPAATPAAASAGPILIGTSLPLSGAHAGTGKEVLAITQSYLQQVNSQGGVGGRQLQLVALDDAYQAAQAEQNARSLVDQGAVALLNCLGTSSCNAMLPAIQAGQLPLVGALAGSGQLRESSGRYVFNLRASTENEVSAMVQQMQSVGQNRIALVYQRDSFGSSGLELARSALRGAQLKPAGELALEADGSNSQEVAKSLGGLEGLQGVILLASASATTALITQSRKDQLSVQFYNLAAQATESLVKGLGEYTGGVVFATLVPSPRRTAIAAVKSYQQLLSTPGAPAPSYMGMEAYLNVHTLVEGLRKTSGKVSRAALISSLDGLDEMHYGPMRVRFAKGRHSGSGYVGLAMLNKQGNFIE